MQKAIKNTLVVAAAGTAVATGIAAVANLVSAYGPERTTYTVDQINQGALDGKGPIFNSIKDESNRDKNVLVDERNFVGARISDGTAKGKDNIWNSSSIEAKDGQEYIVRAYVHNNTKGSTANNTRVAFNIPNESNTTISLNAFINADNATEVWDYVDFKSDQAFHLEYVYGSALLENNHIGKNGGVQLSDDIVKAKSGGALISSYDGGTTLDGRMDGCYEYASYVTIKVKVVYDTDYSVSKKVRVKGDADTKWKESVNAKVGDTVQFRIVYQNKSKMTQDQITIRDVMPDNLEYIPGTTVLTNANHKDGIKIDQDTLTTTGITIGNYTSGSNAYVVFEAKVVDTNLTCGSNTLVNWGRVFMGDSNKLVRDHAEVVVNKACETPEVPVTPNTPSELPSTGAGNIAGAVVAASTTVTAAGYYIASRRALKH